MDDQIALFGIHVNSGVETSNQIDFNLTEDIGCPCKQSYRDKSKHVHTHTHQTDENVNKTLSGK